MSKGQEGLREVMSNESKVELIATGFAEFVVVFTAVKYFIPMMSNKEVGIFAAVSLASFVVAIELGTQWVLLSFKWSTVVKVAAMAICFMIVSAIFVSLAGWENAWLPIALCAVAVMWGSIKYAKTSAGEHSENG